MAAIGTVTAESLFLSSFEAYSFTAVFFLWIASETIGSGIIPRLRQSGRVRSRKNIGSALLVYGAVCISICVAVVLAGKGIAMLPDWAFYLGIFLMLLGIIVRQWSIYILGRFFSTQLGVQKGHRVVDDGPYRYIRHPSYLGALMTFIGMAAAFRSWGGIIVAMVLLVVAYGYRIHVEEKILASELGDDYIQYRKRTKRLIPFFL